MGSAWRIECRSDDAGAPFVFEGVFERFLDAVDTTQVTTLVFGRWGESDDIVYVEYGDLTWPTVDVDLSDPQTESRGRRSIAVAE